jgi:histidinol-phosphate aminotransferase
MFTLDKIVRPNIKQLEPYSSARDEFKGNQAILLDANESPYNAPYNRYPDPLHIELKKKIGQLKEMKPGQIFLGNGSDEAIDLVLRVFCEPGKHKMITIDPTYGMYKVCAGVNNVEVKKVKLTTDFQLDAKKMLEAVDNSVRVIMLCSPNNPTSNCLDREAVIQIVENFNGMVVMDEAYIDFSPGNTFLGDIENYPNLIVLQTFSKAWGLAGIRLGCAFANEEVITLLNKIKYPYNVNILTARKAFEKLDQVQEKDEWVETILQDREELKKVLGSLQMVKKIYPSDANFLLIKVDNARAVYDYLVSRLVIVRDRSQVSLCENCLRVTVGTRAENTLLVSALRDYQEKAGEI